MNTINISNYRPKSALNTLHIDLIDCLSYELLPAEQREFTAGRPGLPASRRANKSEEYAHSETLSSTQRGPVGLVHLASADSLRRVQVLIT